MYNISTFYLALSLPSTFVKCFLASELHLRIMSSQHATTVAYIFIQPLHILYGYERANTRNKGQPQIKAIYIALINN